MVSSEEKLEFLKKVTGLNGPLPTKEEAQNLFYTFFKRDTFNKKLYKYRYFDQDGNHVSALMDGILYCSSPKAFNDPFDCKFGLSIMSLAKAKYKNEFIKIDAILNKFLEIRRGLDCIEECNSVEQRIIRKLFADIQLMKIVDTISEYVSTQEDCATILFENKYVIEVLLKTIFLDEDFGDSFKFGADILPNISKNISQDGILKITQEDVSYKDYAHAIGIMDDGDEFTINLKMCEMLCPEYLDEMESFSQSIEMLENNFNDSIRDHFVVGCLCTDFKNPLMWSHYADSHKGFCIEYDFKDFWESNPATFPFPVFYTNQRPLLPLDCVFDMTDEKFAKSLAEITIGLLTKDEFWTYENEWRFIIKNDSQLYALNMPNVSCVYLGAAIRDENREKILEIANEKHFSVKQMTVDRGAYDLHAVDVFIV